MDVLQQSLEQALATMPALFLENLIARKLNEQGITATKGLSAKLAKHVLSGDSKPFRFRRGTQSQNITLALNEKDADEVIHAFERFCKTEVPKLIPSVATQMSKSTLRNLKLRWADEHALQNADLARFREHLEERWGKPLGQLRMLLTMSREWCEWTHNREKSLQ